MSKYTRNGKKWILSLGEYDKSENYTIEMVNDAGTVVRTFVSIKECASFLVYILILYQIILIIIRLSKAQVI